MGKRKGFTLVEIMIVVAIIALLLAIAIPSLFSARITANQAAARANIKTLCSELEAYAAGEGSGAYPATVAVFQAIPGAPTKYCGAPCATAGTGCGGYVYTCTVAAGDYTLVAAPLSAQTGTVTYTATTSGVITP